MAYDPQKAHDYYERTKQLKGLTKGSKKPTSSQPVHNSPKVISGNQKAQATQARIGRMRENVSKLKNALSECEAELSKKRQAARQTKKESSDGKTSVDQRKDSKDYRDKHKTELATKRKKTSGSGSSKSSKPSSKDVSSMSVQDLTARATKLKSALREAKRLLSDATQELGQLTHSAIRSEPNVNEQFARYQSAERIPSK